MLRTFLSVSVLVLIGCGGSPSATSGATCPTGSTLTYDNFGRQFFTTYCNRCHANGRESPSLNSVATIRANAGWIDSEAAAGPTRVNRAMPEGSPSPTEAERRQLGEWLACGAP